MLLELNSQDLSKIRNEAFRQYAKIYLGIDDHFLAQIQSTGMELDKNHSLIAAEKRQKLKSQGATCRNNGKSLYINWLSPACSACRKGTGSATFYLSLMCPRHCYYCFNPNQEDYGHFSLAKRDCIRELEIMNKTGQRLAYIALTGGEPLLHKEETVEFFRFAREKFRRVHTRLYTAGDLLDQVTLQELKKVQLDEIRFSIKLEDTEKVRRQVYERIAMAREYIPSVMVEMPVIPGTLPEMKGLLQDLRRLEITGINLLEFCFPFHNVQEFRRRSLMIKNPPYRMLYNYWYAGGLPVSRSELECLELMEFALAENVKFGVHYCSLENKHTGQIFQQNSRPHKFPLTYLSPNDFFLKTAKVFGDDIAPVVQIFKKRKASRYQFNKEHEFLEFHIEEMRHLKKLNIEVGIASSIIEEREGGLCLRELKIDLTYPQTFQIQML